MTCYRQKRVLTAIPLKVSLQQQSDTLISVRLSRSSIIYREMALILNYFHMLIFLGIALILYSCRCTRVVELLALFTKIFLKTLNNAQSIAI